MRRNRDWPMIGTIIRLSSLALLAFAGDMILWIATKDYLDVEGQVVLVLAFNVLLAFGMSTGKPLAAMKDINNGRRGSPADRSRLSGPTRRCP